jgi:tRNA(Ile)-lysidine synthase
MPMTPAADQRQPERLRQRFHDHWCTLGVRNCRLLLAVSGGADSLALMHLLAAAAPGGGLDLVVAHVDHGIAADSGQVAAMVEAAAADLHLPCRVARLALGPSAGETAARAARWDALRRVRNAVGADWIVTAHHRDDQSETVLMRFLRGSGPAGLAGMVARADGLLRPLLPFGREELARHVHALGLVPWSDPANSAPRHDRAWVRTELLPLLARRWPGVSADIARGSADARRWRTAWEQAIEQLPGLDLRADSDGISVAATVLAGYDSALGWAVARAFARRAGAVISSHAADRVLMLTQTGVSGQWVPLGGGWRAELAFGRLLIERSEVVPAATGLQPEPGETTWGRWLLVASQEVAPAQMDRSGWTTWIVPVPLLVRARRPGDRLRPLGAPGHRTVARLLQEALVPLGRRDGWPVVEAAGAPCWVPGVSRGEHALPQPGSEALRLDALYR